MKIKAVPSISLLALTAGAQDGSIVCQTTNGSPVVSQAQAAVSGLDNVPREQLCAATIGGFAVLYTGDSAKLTICSNFAGGAERDL
ncbi:MAG: hypothetical protein M1836_007775 [Candelina mexicana]|nr:MAG: hypothetical protein M1836_007775 [Candelina mexicana]